MRCRGMILLSIARRPALRERCNVDLRPPVATSA
jgi:hypothetical protein